MSETAHLFLLTTLNTLGLHFNRVLPTDLGQAPPPLPGQVIASGQSASPEFTPGGGAAGIGGQGYDTAPTILISNRTDLNDDVHMTLGAHSLTWGGLFERFQLNSSKYNRPMGVWTSTNITTMAAGQFTQFRGAVPPYGTYRRGFRNISWATGLQDDWRLSQKLTLNLGLRWEPYTVPTEVNGLISNLRNVTDTQGTVGSPY